MLPTGCLSAAGCLAWVTYRIYGMKWIAWSTLTLKEYYKLKKLQRLPTSLKDLINSFLYQDKGFLFLYTLWDAFDRANK